MVQIGETVGRTAIVNAWRTGQKSEGYID